MPPSASRSSARPTRRVGVTLRYLALAEEADPYLREVALRGGHHQLGWLDRLEAEHDNLRAVLDRLAAAGEAELVLRMAGALVEFWFENAHFVELRTRLPAALEADSQPTAPRAKASRGQRHVVGQQDLAGAMQCADEALAIYRALDDPRAAPIPYSRLGSFDRAG